MNEIYPINTFKQLRGYIYSDLYRYMTSTSLKARLRAWYISGFRYTFFMRSCKYFHSKRIFLPLYFICRIALRHYSVKYGFQIPWQTDIGPGLCIGHYGPIIVNPNARIGANCNITVGVLLGLNHKLDADGKSLGFEYPSIGDRVSLGNNCKIIGGVHIGNKAVIGVSSIVTHNIPDNSIAVGIPAQIISDKGSAALVGSFHPFSFDHEEKQEIINKSCRSWCST